jgi:hypothetical protein
MKPLNPWNLSESSAHPLDGPEWVVGMSVSDQFPIQQYGALGRMRLEIKDLDMTNTR